MYGQGCWLWLSAELWQLVDVARVVEMQQQVN
jgi:hypothetical protein